MLQFKCDSCGNQFNTHGEILEYNSPVYGPCSKKVADCPKCGSQSDEYRAPKMSKSKSAYYHEAMPAMGGCASGGCCRQP